MKKVKDSNVNLSQNSEKTQQLRTETTNVSKGYWTGKIYQQDKTVNVRVGSIEYLIKRSAELNKD